MKKIYALLLPVIAFSYAGAQNIREQQSIWLNKKNYVYLIFDANVSEVKFDCEPDEIQLEQLTPNSFGLRFGEYYAVPAEGLGGMVVLANRTFYPLWIRFSEQIPRATIHFPGEQALPVADTAGGVPPVVPDFSPHCTALLQSKRNILTVGEKTGGFEVQLHAIGVTATHLYFLIVVVNHSKVDYGVDYHGLHIRTKNTVSGGDEIIPLQHVCNEPVVIKAGDAGRYVLVCDLFTLKKRQEILYVMKELNGGRSVTLKIKSSYLYDQVHRLQ